MYHWQLQSNRPLAFFRIWLVVRPDILVNLSVVEPLTSSAMFARHKFEREEKSDGKDIKESAEYK